MKKHAPFTLALVATCLSLLVTLILLEIVLQLLPVRSYMSMVPVTEEDPVIRYEPNLSYTYSAGWDFDAYSRGKTNAQGYVSDFDYDEKSTKPLIALIGDSYVEARMISFENTMHEQIRKKRSEGTRVYNFGMGGAPLSQYLIFARHARDTYKPDYLIVNIISNDFDESLPRYKNLPRFHYFMPDEKGNLHPKLIPYRASWIKELASRSALIRYLYFHLKFERTVNKMRLSWRTKKEAPAKTKSKPDEKAALSKGAIDTFLKLLPEYAGLPKNRILLVIDGQRPQIYTGESKEIRQKTYFGQMRTHLINRAKNKGYSIIDMHHIFAKHYEKHEKRFEFEKDGHWNALAHSLAAQAILNKTPKNLTRN